MNAAQIGIAERAPLNPSSILGIFDQNPEM